MITTSSEGNNAFIGIDIGMKRVWFSRTTANSDDSAVIAVAARDAIMSDRCYMENRLEERTRDLMHAERRIAALKGQITRMKRRKA